MIITHMDADGWCSAGIFLLTNKSKLNGEKIETVRYSTVSYLNVLLKQILKNNPPSHLFIFDLNADDIDLYKDLLKQLSIKGFKITLIDHHQVPEIFDSELREFGADVSRNTTISCSELVFRHFKDSIDLKDQSKAEFLMCIGAIGDKKITDFIKEKFFSFRWEDLFDLYAVLVAGIRDGKEFLKSILEEKDKDGVGFTKRIYQRARRNRFWLEVIKKEVLENHEKIGKNICIIHIFKRYIGLAAGIMIEFPNIQYAIAVGDKLPRNNLNRILVFFKTIFSYIFNRKSIKEDRLIRISIRATKPIDKIITKVARSCNGFGGGHKYACGARVPKDQVNRFIKILINELNNA